MLKKEGSEGKNFGKKYLKVAGLIAVFLVVFLLSLSFWLETRFAGKIILSQADKILRSRVGLTIKADRLKLNVFKLQVVLAGLQAQAMEKSSLPLDYFFCQKLIFQTDWRTIVGRGLYIKNLQITGPKISLKLVSKKPSEKETVASALSSPLPKINFRIDNLEIRNGSFWLKGVSYPISFSLSALEIKINYQKEFGRHLLWIYSTGGNINLSGGQTNLKSLELKGDFDQEKINIEKFSLDTAGSNLHLAGKIEDYARSLKLGLALSGRISLAEINELVKLKEKNSGYLNLNLKAEGKINDLGLTGLLEGRALSLYGINPLDLELNLEKKKEPVQLIEGKIRMPGGEIKLKAELARNLKGFFQAKLGWENFDLSSISAFFSRLPFIVNSSMSGTVEIKGTELSPEKAAASVELKFEPLRAVPPKIPNQLILPLQARLIASYLAGKIEVKDLELNFYETKIKFKGALEKYNHISGDLSFRLSDLEATRTSLLSSGLSGNFPELNFKLEKLKGLKGSLQLEGSVSGALIQPEFFLNLKTANLSWQKVLIPSIELVASGNINKFNLQKFTICFVSGRINGSGRFFKLGPPISSPYGLEGNIEFSQIDLKQFASILPESSRYLNGVLSGTVRLAGSQISPQVKFGFNLDEAGGGSFKINSLQIAGDYKDGILNVEKFLMLQPDSQLKGKFVLAKKSGELQAELSGQNLKLSLLKDWLLGIQSGQVDFHLQSVGPWKSPVLNFELSGQGLLVDKIWLPYFELKIKADGKKLQASFDVPRFNLNLTAGLDLYPPYWLRGQILVKGLPLSSLSGLWPDMEEVPPEVALTATTDFSLPLQEPEKLQAQFKFENFDFKGLAAFIPALKNMNPGGGANGRIIVNGFSSDLSKVKLLAEVDELNLKLNELKIRNEGPLVLNLKDGQLNIENFILSTERSRLQLSGHSQLQNLRNPQLDFWLQGNLETSDFNSWLTGMTAGGEVQLQVRLKGSLQDPLVQGEGNIKDVFIRLQDLPIVISQVIGHIEVDNSRISLTQLKGLANSGNFLGGGEAFFGSNFNLKSAQIKFILNDFDFNYQGLSTLSQASLTLSREKQGWLLGGEWLLLGANYRQDFYPSTQGLKLALSRVSPVGTEIPSFLYDIALDINFKTVENILIKNNLADLELKANLNARGTLPAPILSGRIENAYPGEIIIGERRYAVERIRVDFLGKENLEPNLDIALKSTVTDQEEEVEIGVNLAGTPSDLKFSLTSIPVRSQEDLASLLLTGKSLKEVQGSALNTISSQLIQQFSSPLTSPVSRTLKKWLKAEDIILEPLNIATLQDPGARLTIKKRMTREVAVTYSINLTNSQYQTWILDYNLRRNFSLRGFRQDNGTIGVNLRHRFSVGQKITPSGEEPGKEGKRLIRIEVNGETVFSPEQVKKLLKLKVGKEFKNSELQKALERLSSAYRKKGYINTRLETRAEEDKRGVSLFITVRAAQPVKFEFKGDRLPSGIKKKALNSWIGRLPEEANLSQLQQSLLLELQRRGYYQAKVDIKKIEGRDKITYLIEVAKGGQWKIKSFKLEGHPVFNESLIKRVVSDYFGAKARGLWNLVYDRKIALELIQYFYLENGYLQAKLDQPVVNEYLKLKEIDLRLKIEAGPQSHIRTIKFEGNKVLSQVELEKVIDLKSGSIFSWPALTESKTALVNRYRSAGFKEARIEAVAEKIEGSPDYQVVFEIEEGPAFLISKVEIAGAKRSKPSFILKESGLKPGEPVSLEKMAQAQKNLYDSGVFQEVNLSSFQEKPEWPREKVSIKVRELPWLTLTYGLQYNSDTKFEGNTQFDFNNLLGHGWNSLLFLRANRKQQEARYSLKIPYIFSKKTDSLLSFYYFKDIKDLYVSQQIGTSFQQKITVIKGFDLSWVYKLNRIHDYERTPSWPFPYDVRVLTSEVSMVLNRDTRDDRFDPHKGSLLTTNFSYSPKFLGSDLNYISTFTQFTMYKSIISELLWASCYRLGLASAFGEVLIPSKRFFAGGGTSIRGFKLDAVGPVDIWTGQPEGGEAMLVVNQELRFPIYKIFRGVVFLDAGNVYSRLRNFNPLSLRTGAGLGLRVETPVGLLRIDYGFNLKPRPGEPKGTVFFSLGQAF